MSYTLNRLKTANVTGGGPGGGGLFSFGGGGGGGGDLLAMLLGGGGGGYRPSGGFTQVPQLSASQPFDVNMQFHL